jgi:hypothetical protein
MKTLTIAIAIALIAFTARASEPVPYIAMPIDNGYAIDSHGNRQPNASCARDVIWACPSRYPIQSHSIDPTTWSRNHRGDGLYRLDINQPTGKTERCVNTRVTPRPRKFRRIKARTAFFQASWQGGSAPGVRGCDFFSDADKSSKFLNIVSR